MLIPTTGLTETTNNLVSQDFTTGWSGTNVDTTHGSDTIAGVHGEYVESDSVSLNTDLNLNKPTINNGFTITGSANIWFWNSYTQSVTQTIKTIDDNDNIITQNRVIDGNSNATYYTNYSDSLVINSNSQSDYEISLRYDFDVPNTTGHYGADLKDPSLTVEYTFKEELDTNIQSTLALLSDDIEDDIFFEDIKFEDIKEESFLEEPTMMMEVMEEPTTNSFIEFFEEPKQEEKLDEPIMEMEMVEGDKEQEESLPELSEEFTEEETEEEKTTSELLQEGFKEEQEENEKEEEPNSETTETAKVENENNTKQKNVQSKERTANATSQSRLVKLDKIMDKVDKDIKDISKNLQIKNIIKLDAMTSDQASLDLYDIPFYKSEDVYLDQLQIQDLRQIYTDNTLARYTSTDPIAIINEKLNQINVKKQKILIELEQLKNEL